MKVPPFESEFDAAQLPQVDGQPLTNKELDGHVGGMGPWQRVEQSQQTLVVEAVESYYLAKRFREKVLTFDQYSNAVVANALTAVGERLLRVAVVAVASVNDTSGEGRTRSLPHTLDALGSALDQFAVEDVVSERASIADLKASVNADTVTSLKYVRHLRNKWAGHASLDRAFDEWAGADSFVFLPLVEDALVRLVGAHRRMAELIEESAVLRSLNKSPDPEEPGGLNYSILMTVDWSAVVPLAEVAREWAGRAAESMLDQLQSPPGYGSAGDTDWRVGSEHDRRRRLIDDEIERYLGEGD